MGQTKICGFLRKSAVSCRFENLRLQHDRIPRKSGNLQKSAKICEKTANSARFVPFRLSLLILLEIWPPPISGTIPRSCLCLLVFVAPRRNCFLTMDITPHDPALSTNMQTQSSLLKSRVLTWTTRHTVSTRRIGANPEKSDLVNFGGPNWRKFSELSVLLFFLGKTDKMLPKSSLVNQFSATPRGQLNWTGPIANGSDTVCSLILP